jgi:hypothetical protein
MVRNGHHTIAGKAVLAPSTSVRLDLQREGAQRVFVVRVESVDSCFSPNLLLLPELPRPDDNNDKHHQDSARKKVKTLPSLLFTGTSYNPPTIK